MNKTFSLQPLFDNFTHLQENPGAVPVILKQLEESQQDYQLAWRFLYSYRGSIPTFTAYRREVERLLQWSWHIRQKNLSALQREDIEAFVEFCQNPPLHWIGTQQADRFTEKDGQRLPNPDWRPFVATISKQAHRQGHSPDSKQYTMS